MTTFLVFRLSQKASGAKKKVPQRAVRYCSLWHLFLVFRLSREASGTLFWFSGYLEKLLWPKKRYHREQLDTALCGIFYGFQAISRSFWDQKKRCHKEQLDTALCDILFWFSGYLKKLLGPKKVPQRAVRHCSLWHLFWFSGYLEKLLAPYSSFLAISRSFCDQKKGAKESS